MYLRTILLLLAAVAAGFGSRANAQNVALKTNVLSDAFLNPNIGIEIGLAPKWTIEAVGQFNLWKQSHDRQWRHWALQPKPDTGSATASPAISSDCTSTADNTTSAVSATSTSVSSELTSQS